MGQGYHRAAINGRQHAVYRIYGDGDVLLYVGVALNPAPRLMSHQKQSWWFNVKIITLEWFETREEAESVEFAAIRLESPVHNVNLNSDTLEYRGRRPGPQTPGRSRVYGRVGR